jgi:O-antigen/teichoic acid export membrane protein
VPEADPPTVSRASPTPRPGPRALASRLRAAREDSLLRNSAFGMATTVVTSALGFLYWVVAARFFDAHDVGVAAALVSAMMLGATLGNPGVHTFLVERLPERRPGPEWSATINAAVLVALVLGVAAGGAAALVMPGIDSDFDALAAWGFAALFVAGVALTSVATILDYTWIAERSAGGTLARNAIFALLKIPVLAVPAVVALDAAGIFASWVGSLAATALVSALFLPRLGRAYRLTASGVRREVALMRRRVMGHHLANLGNLIPMNVLPILVAATLSPVMAAYFYATWRLAGIMFMISPSVATSLFAEGSHDAEALGGHARRAGRLTMGLLAPACLVMAAAGYPLLLLFGEEYAREGIALLLLLVLSAVPDAVSNIYMSVLRVQRRMRAAALLSLGPSTVALIVAWLLMPRLELVGVGVAWLGTRIVAAALALADARRVLRTRQPDARAAAPAT